MSKVTHRRSVRLLLLAALALAGLGAASVGAGAAKSPQQKLEAYVVLRDASKNVVGRVYFFSQDTKISVLAVGAFLAPGFHGFHVHAIGTCEPPFTSAGGHLNPSGSSHPNHRGDMPPLFVNADGKARVEFLTDRIVLADLFDPDGSAIIVHADPDNLGNIPSRYGVADTATLGTGDSGARVACGVVVKAKS